MLLRCNFLSFDTRNRGTTWRLLWGGLTFDQIETAVSVGEFHHNLAPVASQLWRGILQLDPKGVKLQQILSSTCAIKQRGLQ
jgi:hypothetical protein